MKRATAASALLLLFVVLVGTASATRSPGSTIWAQAYFHGGNDVGEAVAFSPDSGTVFMTGRSEGSGTSYDYATVAYDTSTGTKDWEARYAAAGQSDDESQAIAVSPDGTKVFVTGRSGADAVTVAYDASTGSRLWVNRFASGGSVNAGGGGVVVSPNSKRVFVGIGEPGGDYVVLTLTAATGGKIWSSTYNAGGGYTDDLEKAIALSPDGSKVVVTGVVANTQAMGKYATVAFNAATGARLWAATYNAAGSENTAAAIAINPGGTQVFVTGRSSTGSTNASRDYATVAYNLSTGAQQWVARYDGAGDDDEASGIVATASRVIVTGASVGSGTSEDMATVAYNPSTGAQLWASRYNDPQNGTDGALAIALAPDAATVYVAGAIAGPAGDLDYGTVAYNASTGARKWVARRSNSGSDIVFGVATSANGDYVAVTGSTTGTGNTDATTVEYAGYPIV